MKEKKVKQERMKAIVFHFTHQPVLLLSACIEYEMVKCDKGPLIGKQKMFTKSGE